MSLRRRSSRLQVLNADGVLRVWRDVVGSRTDQGDYVVISTEPALKGEHLTIYFASGTDRSIQVRVIDSQPLIVDGSVRHQLRLTPLEADITNSLEATRNGVLEAE